MNPATVLARMVLQALAAAGVGHVVLAPGSRSAPLAYELAGQDRLSLLVRQDERVAGFTALGLGLAGRPAAVVTTSGTAVANLHPSVLEAHHAGVPLLLLTADRPVAARGTWANQTSDLQADLFGAAVRSRIDLMDTAATADPDRAWAGLVVALEHLRGRHGGERPGPVHLNLGFSEPLLPAGPVPAGRPRPVPLARPPAAEPALELPAGPRTVVVAGDRSGPAARELAEARGWPLLAEPSSGSRGGPNTVGGYRLLLPLPELGGRVQRVVAFGRPTLSRPVTALLGAPEVELVVITPYDGWPDPGRPARYARQVAPGPADRNGQWLAQWLRCGAAAQRAITGVLAGTAAPSGLEVAAATAAASAEGDALVVAASNAVRDLDLTAAGWPGQGPLVVANRGLSGIDGTLSTGCGVATAWPATTRVLLGDLAFLHDANALLAPPDPARPPLQVVVVNDDGGGIFSVLEHGGRAQESAAARAVFEQVFATPHGADLGALCAGYRVPHELVTDRRRLAQLLADPPPGTSVLEVRTDRQALRPLHARLQAAVLEAAEPALAG